MQGLLSLPQSFVAHVFFPIKINYIIPNFFGAFFADGGVEAADARVGLFYVQHRRVVVDLAAVAEGLHPAVDADEPAPQPQGFEIAQGSRDGQPFFADGRIVHGPRIAPSIGEAGALVEIGGADGLEAIVGMIPQKSVVMVLLAVELAPGESGQFFPQIDVIPIVSVFFEDQFGDGARQTFFGALSDAPEGEGLPFVSFDRFQDCGQFFRLPSQRRQEEIAPAPFHSHQKKIAIAAPIDIVAVLPDEKIAEGSFAGPLPRLSKISV